MSHLSTSEGSAWEFDGIVSRTSDDRENPARQRQNEVHLLKFLQPVDVALPAFVCGNPTLKPCRDTIILSLNIRRLIQFPDLKVHSDFSVSHFGLKNSAVVKHLQELETTSPEAGTVLPVEIGERTSDKGATPCVLLLEKELDDGKFLCKLYRSDSSAKLHPGDILRRRACLPLRDKTYTSEADIGTIEKIIERNEVAEEEPDQGIVNHPPDGAVFPIECAACKRKFDAADFTAEQIQVIDLWTWYYPEEQEKSLLERAIALFRKHPGLREECDARSDSRLFGSYKKAGRRADPSKRRFLDATANDLKLREFLSTRSCSWDVRYQRTCESAKKYEQVLDGRCVICPNCGDGPVVIRDNT